MKDDDLFQLRAGPILGMWQRSSKVVQRKAFTMALRALFKHYTPARNMAEGRIFRFLARKEREKNEKT